MACNTLVHCLMPNWKPIELCSDGDITALVNPENSQLISLKKGRAEFMYDGGFPTELRNLDDPEPWKGNTVISMWPIVGPAMGGKIIIGGAEYEIGQHGVIRHMKFENISQKRDRVLFKTHYNAGDPIPNTKYKGAGDPKSFILPYGFEYSQEYKVLSDRFRAIFSIRNLSEKDIQYAHGWHPAFLILKDNDEGLDGQLDFSGIKMAVRDVKGAEGSTVYVPSNKVMYSHGGRFVEVSSDMGKMMVWSLPKAKLICLEPVTKFASKDFRQFGPDDKTLQPGETHYYSADILVGFK